MNNQMNARGVAGAPPILSVPTQSAIPPAPALRIEPYRLSPGPWWCCIDTDTGRSFGGRYSAQEAAYIASRFRGRQGPIEPREFGAVAEDAIRLTRMMGVAA